MHLVRPPYAPQCMDCSCRVERWRDNGERVEMGGEEGPIAGRGAG